MPTISMKFLTLFDGQLKTYLRALRIDSEDEERHYFPAEFEVLFNIFLLLHNAMEVSNDITPIRIYMPQSILFGCVKRFKLTGGISE
jgi:hypothetical protein